MIPVDRRTFLSSLFATAGVAAMPDWLADALAVQDPVSTWREKGLRAAVDRARTAGKPLLLLVAPTGDHKGDGFVRGQWLGAWLNHGGPQALSALALCELACASTDELQRVTGASPPAADATMVLVDVVSPREPKDAPPKSTPIQVALGSMYVGHVEGQPPPTETTRRAHVETGLAALTTALQDGLNRHGATVARVAADVAARLEPAQQETITRWLAGGAVPAPELVVRGAPVVRRAAAELPDAKRQPVLDALVAAVAAHVVKRPVAGARWQLPGGCGATFEEPTPAEREAKLMVACGMGMVPPLCERFLNFYVAGA